MHPPRKAAAMAASLIAALSAAAIAQAPPAAAPSVGQQTLVIDDATVEWIEKSEVSALREGVIDRMELKIGMRAIKGTPIGYLHDEIAKLTEVKARVAAKALGAMNKALAQRENAIATVARLDRLRAIDKKFVSLEELDKARAELKVTEAMIEEAKEKRGLDEADLGLATQAVSEHVIRAPFDGVVIERMKHPGETVRANEAVVTLGNLDKLRAFAFVPIDYAFRVKEGGLVELQPRISGARGGVLPIEKKKFRGKITFVDPQIQPVSETAVRIFAEFENKDHELRPGLKAEMTIFLGPEEAAPAPAPAPAVGSRSDLPVLPR